MPAKITYYAIVNEFSGRAVSSAVSSMARAATTRRSPAPSPGSTPERSTRTSEVMGTTSSTRSPRTRPTRSSSGSGERSRTRYQRAAIHQPAAMARAQRRPSRTERAASQQPSAAQMPGRPSQWKRRTASASGANAKIATIIARRIAT
jgi:hypothetical protein